MPSPRSHRFVVCILALTVAFFPHTAVTRSQPITPQQSDTTAKTKADQNKVKCADNGTYVNTKGQSVKRPENCSAAPQGATAYVAMAHTALAIVGEVHVTSRRSGEVALTRFNGRNGVIYDIKIRLDLCLHHLVPGDFGISEGRLAV